MSSYRQLLIFVKNPELGKVKTRLAASIGDKEALNVYRKLLQLTHQQTRKLDADKTVWYSSFIPDNDLWDSDSFHTSLQQGSNLGNRMLHAFKTAFQKQPKSKVIIIGSDCPGITTELLEKAYQALENKEIVIGPARDGGYYLLGMCNFHPEVFEDIDWSTSKVREQTLDVIKANQWSYELLEELNDIDTVEDLEESELY
ncbi:TIGR04282 family arsenosugar biosynthesis glycosyltransferase [Gracilimonas mengyeensis]|uniref:Glycosyltransferase n=1 Tax=Gracilimonas mengyeensis TaxID=1302730 RepID=A0A521EMF9_9BACT|nr:TIGR04282 family arsenosugar biosynthesis glycosyltransferase [Gracilimonas mengyeensis]SMO84631.1 hypothetical protein SAMN06265219_112124 [Gracilimonas mengyeensis]